MAAPRAHEEATAASCTPLGLVELAVENRPGFRSERLSSSRRKPSTAWAARERRLASSDLARTLDAERSRQPPAATAFRLRDPLDRETRTYSSLSTACGPAPPRSSRPPGAGTPL